MDGVNAFLNHAVNICVTFTIPVSLARDLPLKKPTIPGINPGRGHILAHSENVQINELPSQLNKFRYWIPRAYRKPQKDTDDAVVNAVFHLVKCQVDSSIRNDKLTRSAMSLFQKLCGVSVYTLSVYQYETAGNYGLHLQSHTLIV